MSGTNEANAEFIETCVKSYAAAVGLIGERDRFKIALTQILEITENCLHGNAPLVARQTFGSPIRAMRRLAAEALEPRTIESFGVAIDAKQEGQVKND
jgi:hypothetical protein